MGYMFEAILAALFIRRGCICATPRAGSWGVQAALVLVVLGMFANAMSLAAAESSSKMRGRIQIDSNNDSRQPDLARAVVFFDAHPNLQSHDDNNQRPHMTQKNKGFTPNLLVVSAGTTVEFPNGDPYSHNVFSRSRPAQFDLDRYPQGVSKSYRFDNVGMVQLFCNIHPQMRAVILVVPNRHFARADADGRFEVHGLPQGDYTLVAWHERTGSRRLNVSVGPAATQEIVVPLQVRPSRVGHRSVRRRNHTANVERGLGLKQERLNLPVVHESHSAPQASR